MQVGISAIEYALPERRVALEQLESTDKLESPAARLREFGFEAVHVSDEPAERLVNVAVARLLENHAVSPDSVDALFYAGAIPGSHFVKGRNGAFLDGFSYPAAKLHYDFGRAGVQAAIVHGAVDFAAAGIEYCRAKVG